MSSEHGTAARGTTGRGAGERRTGPLGLILAWGFVGVPLLWGVLMTLRDAVKLFR